MNYKNYNENRGYTLLFAVLVSSLVLGVGVSILSISKKEFALSSSARDSSIAFYSADSGIDCALERDFYGDAVFSTSTYVGDERIYCMDNDSLLSMADTDVYSEDPNAKRFFFHIKTSPDSSSRACAVVFVDKYVESATGDVRTVVSSYGYNFGWNNDVNNPLCVEPSPKKVERLLLVTY